MNFAAFLASPAGLALKGMLVAAFLDFAFGVYGAAKDNSFSFDVLAAFVRKHLLGRVFPIGTLLVAGYATGDVVMNSAAVAAGAAYVAETLGSIYASIKPAPPVVASKSNPVPVD